MTIRIITGNEFTITTLVNGQPDLSAFTEQSRTVRQDAFDRGDWEELQEITPTAPMDREIDARRLRLALLQLELLDDVEAAIATLDRAAQIEWEYATIIKENYPLVEALTSNLGIDADAIFTLAESME